MKLTIEALEMLGRRQCTLWPECGCYSLLERWGRMLQDDGREWKFDDLEAGEVMIFVSLCCVRSHCPDEVVKEIARQQLKKPFWDRQKGMGGYVEEQ